jgi:hypothetical protein
LSAEPHVQGDRMRQVARGYHLMVDRRKDAVHLLGEQRSGERTNADEK